MSELGERVTGVEATIRVALPPELVSKKLSLPELSMVAFPAVALAAKPILPSGLLRMEVNRSVSGSILLVVLLVLVVLARRRGVPAFPGLRRAWALIVACGVADAAANVLILLGLRMGDLTVMSVLAALYPGGTIALAALVLRERIAPVQWAGLVLALASAAVLAIPAG